MRQGEITAAASKKTDRSFRGTVRFASMPAQPPPLHDRLAPEVDDQRTDDDRHARHGAEIGVFAGQHDPAQHGSQDRIDQTAHIDVADLRALGAQGHEPETEGEDRDEDQHAETRIEPDGLGPEGVETLRRDAHAVNQQAAEKHLHGIQEDRIDLALVLRNQNRGIALKQDAGQQQDDTPDAAPVERRTVAARADDQQQSREAHRKTHDLVTVQAVVAGHEVRQQHVDQRREAHDDRADGPADEIDTEIEGRIAHEHIDQDQVAEKPPVLHDLAPHAAMPGVGEENDSDNSEAQAREIHRREIVAQSLLDERIDNRPQYRGQHGVEYSFFHNVHLSAAKVRKTAGKTKPVRANGRAGPGAGRAFAGTAQMPDTASRSGRILILSRIRPGIVKNGTNG